MDGGGSLKVKVFTLPWRPEAGGFDDGDLVSFLAERTAIEVSEHFFVHEKTPVLVLVVTYRTGERAAQARRGAGRADKVDEAADLSPEEKERYEALRTWRNQHARKTGRPPYVIFTNRQAIQIAQKQPRTRAELAEVPGIGTSRVEDYGDALLAFLASLGAAVTAAPAAADGGDAGGG